MSHKSPKIAELIAGFQGRSLESHYLGYFQCFNQQQFFEAHEVLEELWLPQRQKTTGNFYKGLIQLAGAFVHLQKNRPGPAVALFNLAAHNLSEFGPVHKQLDLTGVLELIENWKARAAAWNVASDSLDRTNAPRLALAQES